MLSSGSGVDDVAGSGTDQDVPGLRSQPTLAYLKESAAQVELLQQGPCQAFYVDLLAKDLPGPASGGGAALHDPRHSSTDASPSLKVLFHDDAPAPTFIAHDGYEQLPPAVSPQAPPADSFHGDGHPPGNQAVSPRPIPSSLPGVATAEKAPEEGRHDAGCHGDPLQSTPPLPVPERERLTELVGAPEVFYVETLHEANAAVRRFERETGTKYSAYKSTAGFGNTVYDPAKAHKIYFEERLTDTCCFAIPYDGLPFVNIGKKVMDCQYGMDRSVAAKRKYMERHRRDETKLRRPLAQERTKKVQCRAQIRMKEILKYAGFKVSDQSSSRKERVRVSKKLREALKTGTAIPEKRIYIQLPRMCDHNGHSFGQDAANQVKPKFSGKQAMREVNSLSWDAFIARFGNVIEHGGMAASAVWSRRPFASVKALHSAFCDFIDELSPSGKSAMFRCYPNLLADAPSAEGATISQAGDNDFRHLGLDALSTSESSSLAELSTKYREAFRFSFIICTQETDKEGLWTALLARSGNTASVETAVAAREVKKIAWYRILHRVRVGRPR